MNVAVVDYTAPDAAQRFTASLRETGFAVLVNHPLPMDLVRTTYQEWAELFDSPAVERYLVDPGGQVGWFPPTMAETLKATGIECRIYGMRRGLEAEVVEGNMRYQPFSEDKFIDDLATSRGVIAGGGFTLMGEAVYLHKPMLAIPLAGQFEQLMNARYLAREGYGLAAADAAELGLLAGFVERLPELAARLAGYQQDGNRELLTAVDHFLTIAAQPR